MTVSIVVPTRDRPEALGRCLASLGGQADEVVVVDDGSADPARVAGVAEAAGARLVRLGGSGPAAARNAGAAAARGAVVCFTDDDCEARPGWAAALAAPILSGGTAASGGRTETAAGAGPADRAWQAIVDHLQRAGAEPGSPSPGFAPTCNLAASRGLLAELPFDESFPGAAGEDRDWAARAASLGHAPRFVAEAVVVHRPGLDARSFLRQQYRYGRGAARYRAGGSHRRPGTPSFYAGLLRTGYSRGPAVGTLVLAAQAATVAGVLVERGKGASRAGGYSKRRPN